ncbi:MAG: hypothetical protein ACRDH2_10975, partial [Anaerolineales bacterium]
MESPELQKLLREGIEAIKHGNRVRGRELMLKAVRQNSGLEIAWWWLSESVDDPQDKMLALQNVLALNPSNAEAQQRITQLRLNQTGSAKPAPATAALPTIAGRRVAADRWRSYLPESPKEADDGVDDPLQCVYCGRVTDLNSRRCPHCGRPLYRRVKKAAGSGFIRLLLLFVTIAIALGILDALGPLFALSAAQTQGGTGTFGFDLLLQVFGVEAFLGNFLKLPRNVVQPLINFYLVRLGVLLVSFFGLLRRWSLIYYLAILAMCADVAANFFLLVSGYLGIVGSVANLVLDLVILLLLFASSYEFAVNHERLVVRPETTARNALDFYKRGHDYGKQ